MNIEEKGQYFTQELLNVYFDTVDFYFYNKTNKNATVQQRRDSRNSFIDGQAWSNATLASCIANPTPEAILVAKRVIGYNQTLDKVNGVPGRVARTYRKNGGGDKWIESAEMLGYYYRDGQAKQGPMALASAAAATIKNISLDSSLKIPIQQNYMTFIMRFMEDEYKILNRNGTPSEHGDMTPSGIAGVINKHLVYAMLSVGYHVALELSKPEDATRLMNAAIKVKKGMWSASLVVWGWVTSMGVWDWVLRRFGKHRQKYSNDNLLYMLFSVWAYAPDAELMDGKMRNDMVSACRTQHKMTKDWQNPFFDCIYMMLTHDDSYKDQVRQALSGFSEERRRSNGEESMSKSIVPIDKRKPSIWAWRQNPYEAYEPTTVFDDQSYAAADYVTAYNLYRSMM